MHNGFDLSHINDLIRRNFKKGNRPLVVVSRHLGFEQFINKYLDIDPEDRNSIIYITHVSDPKLINGKLVIGNLPMELAQLCDAVITVSMAIPPEYRGKELSLEEMENFFAYMAAYKVIQL